MNRIIIYKSKYGSCKQYAEWLAKRLDCSIESTANIQWKKLPDYDVIIYIGGLYAGRINGFNQFKKHLSKLQGKHLILCMVGMTNPEQKDKYQQAFINNVPDQYKSAVKPFVLRGDQLFSKMSFIHRIMMKMPKAMAEKVPIEKRTEDDKHFIDNYGKDVRFTTEENLKDIVKYLEVIK